MADLTNEDGFTLSELVKNVADELRTIKPPATDEAVMQFTECQIELNVKVLIKAGAKAQFWVFAEAGGEASREAGHIIRLKFSSVEGNPLQFKSETVDVADLPEKKTPKNKTLPNNG